MPALGRCCSLIPGLGVKLSTTFLAGPPARSLRIVELRKRIRHRPVGHGAEHDRSEALIDRRGEWKSLLALHRKPPSQGSARTLLCARDLSAPRCVLTALLARRRRKWLRSHWPTRLSASRNTPPIRRTERSTSEVTLRPPLDLDDRSSDPAA